MRLRPTEDAAPSRGARARTALGARFGIDTRALATLRIAMGALILVDLFYRAFNLTAFYTDVGVFPRSALLEIRPYFHDISLHALSGGLGLQVALFIMLALAAVALMAGYRTRIATVACFVLLGSLQVRNPFILNSGDTLLLFLLFWGIFLPLGARYSLDARRTGAQTSHVADVASAAILVQVVLIYSMNAFFKFQAGHWVSGEAIQYTFNIDRFSTPLGRMLAHMPPFLVAAGWGWLALLTLSPLLLLTTGRLRIVGVALFVSVHVGMLLFMRLGVFPLVSIASLLPFLPRQAWDALEDRAKTLRARLNVLDKPVPDATQAAVPKQTTPSTWARWSRSAKNPAVSVLLVLLLLWSGFSLGVVTLPDPVQRAVEGHERGWAMFANPSRANVWYVAPAVLESGREVDALHGDETPWHEPTHLDPLYPDIRWRKYLAEFHRIEGGDLNVHFAAYLCHKWDRTNDDPMSELTVIRMNQPIRLDAPNPPATQTPLVTHTC